MGRSVLRLLGWIVGMVAVLLLVVAGLAYTVLQTQTGHDFVLRTALNQAPTYVNGEVRVGGLRSDGLLRGFVLHDVSIRDDRGRPFLDADSLRVRYSIMELAAGNIQIRPVELWGAQVVLETLHGDDQMNVVRIFAQPAPDEPPEVEPDPPAIRLTLVELALHDSELLVRQPVEGDEPPARGVVETVPGVEGLHQRFHFTDIQARLARADILDRGREGERFEVESLSFTGQIFEEVFELADLRGVVERVGTRLEMELERLWLPETELAGRVGLDWGDPEAGLELDVSLDAPVVQLADLQWLEPRIPRGEGRLSLSVQGPLASSRWRFTNTDLQVEESRVRGMVGFDLGDEFRFVATEVEALPLDLDRLEPWLEEPLPVAGRVEGRVRMAGPFRALQLSGEVTYDDPEAEIPPSTVDFAGTLELGDEVAVRDMIVTGDPLDYGTLRAFAPELEVQGVGRLEAELSGGLTSGIALTASLVHRPTEGGVLSQVVASGTIRESDGAFELDLDGYLDPLSLDGVAMGLRQELPVSGEVSGPVRVNGFLGDLFIGTTLATEAGQLQVEGRFDILEPGRRYRAQGQVQEFALHRVFPDLPEPTVLTGSFEVDGGGITLETVDGSARLDLSDVNVAGAEVEHLVAALQARDGRLLVDSLALRSPLGRLDGRGDLGLREGSAAGEVSADWEIESLANLRPMIFGDTLIAVDTLSDIERMNLQMQGIDPDTLPDAQAARIEGRAHGELNLRGTFRDLEGDGFVELTEAVYGDLGLGEARADFTGHFRRGDVWGVEGRLGGERFTFGEYALESGWVEVAYEPEQGVFEAGLRRDEAQSYELAGAFARDTAGVDVDLADLALDLGDVVWTLDRPAQLRFEGRTVETTLLRLSRPVMEGDAEGISSVYMEAEGTFALDGESQFRVQAQGADIHRLASILQIADAPRGFLDLDVSIAGPYDAPRMNGLFTLSDFRTGETVLSRVEGTFDYSEGMAHTELMAEMDGRRLLTAEGRVPLDLSFQTVEDRFPDRSVDATLRLDSLPAASALAFLEVLENVDGVLDGEVHVRGTTRDLRPSGRVTLRSGALSLPEQGLHMTEVAGTLDLREDGTVEVDAQARARGTAQVSGTISLADLADPGFDLRVTASNFQAVDRRDLTARVGGEVTLTGSYTRPRIGGRIRVDQGIIFVEEFARTAEVVDLTDPAFFDVVDTMLVATRPALEAAQNPFIQNLRIDDVNVVIQRDFWLRSREMNVEMGGELIVTFDRPSREVLLVGTLNATRGVYSAFGRQFQVQEGTVEFVGTPGIDPALDIQAVHRLRREGGEPLEILANVGGTLTDLRVDLSSEAQPPIAESDLISYLIFGRPSYALASGETSILEGAAGAGVGVGVGAIATQLGQVVAQQFGVDYFTITQTREAGELGAMGAIGGTFAETQIEVGQYLADNLFMAVMLRPLTGLGARTQTQFPGARLEWRFADLWMLEAVLEDRFARQPASGFGDLGLRLDKVLGFSIVREWGY